MPAKATTKRRVPRPVEEEPTEAEVAEAVASLRKARAEAAEAVDTRNPNPILPPDISGAPVGQPSSNPVEPANPYAPTGWRKRGRVEFDLQLPNRTDPISGGVVPGQLCRVARLERDDMLRMNLMDYLDTFTPILMDTAMNDEERQEQMSDVVKDNPEALKKMLTAIDKVVMAAVVRPQITEDQAKVNYGSEKDWGRPGFVATVHLDDIDTFERMFIFAAAFGRSMDDLKSFWEQTQGVAGVEDQQNLQQSAQ